jgi:hypothetical protein
MTLQTPATTILKISVLRALASLALLSLPGCLNILAIGAQGADSREIVRQARQSYYSLEREGLNSFRCTVHPDWEAIFSSLARSSLKLSAVSGQLRTLLEATDFEVSVGPDGAATVSRQFHSTPPTQEIADRARLVAGGIENVLTGFFKTMTVFVYNSPFPLSNSKFDFSESDGLYRISQQAVPGELLLTVDHDLIVKEFVAKMPQVEATYLPQFLGTNRGRILNGYRCKLQATANTSTQTAINSEVAIQYQEVRGLQLPAVLTASVELPGGRLQVRLNFDRYEVEKR